ncbi:M4 family metallopeptidase [Staphylococcus canis]|uniref:Neutral metalloproteinase n=1 Tax=Staphylococcus canis TaxID=2724942 RepID=A0ABS0T5Q9_9STAP|nr:M4 family metallopeptidase [Staphylococcus canis]MBI5974079.1 peptidase M4 family protein [Staphylococcus canis]
MYKKLIASTVLTGVLTLMSQHSASAATIRPVEDTPVHTNKDVVSMVQHTIQSRNHLKQPIQFSIVKSETDALNYTHYTLHPKHQKHLATDYEIKVHVNPEGHIILMNGDLKISPIQPNNLVKLTQSQALSSAFQNIQLNPNQASNGSDKVVQSNHLIINAKQNKYAYDITLITLKPNPSHWNIQVDAETGTIIEKQNLIEYADQAGTGVGVHNDEKPIRINQSSDGYRLEDVSRPTTLSAYRYDASTGIASLIKDSDTRFDNVTQRAGVDANYYTGQIYDYFKNTFNRNSYDNLGSPITSITNVNQFNGVNTTNNAAWIGDKMIYGDGDNRTYLSFAGAKDIIAHELTHGITQETAQLAYTGQTGALNESFSDVFAYFIDFEDTFIGEDIYKYPASKKALRSLENPTLFNQPAHMNQYLNTTQDSGGVHTNSGIPNKAAYLTTQKLGKAKAEQIYYRALTNYLTSNAQFSDAKRALEQAAYDLYGNSAKQTVTNSWNAVGV